MKGDEATRTLSKAGIEIPKTVEDLLEGGWEHTGDNSNVSDDCKTAEGLAEFTQEMNGFVVNVEVPFRSVRTYGGEPVIQSVGLLDK